MGFKPCGQHISRVWLKELEDSFWGTLSANEMYLTSANTMEEYAKKWIKVYAVNSKEGEEMKPYIDFKSFGAMLYADGCYIKTPKGIIERTW